MTSVWTHLRHLSRLPSWRQLLWTLGWHTLLLVGKHCLTQLLLIRQACSLLLPSSVCRCREQRHCAARLRFALWMPELLPEVRGQPLQ